MEVQHRVEVQDIFSRYGAAYRLMYGKHIPSRHHKAMSAIEQCRTAALGGHIEQCDSCGEIRISYNSCRNRHCPKCQSLSKVKWIEKRKADLLPVQYFHVVFTFSDLIYPIALINKRIVYNILFKAVSETLKEVALNPKNLGAEIGFIAVLHTWNQVINLHPHIHCIVPGGGLSKDKTKWIRSPHNFFLPVKILSTVFRAKFLDYLEKAYLSKKFSFLGKISYLSDYQEFKKEFPIAALWTNRRIFTCKKNHDFLPSFRNIFFRFIILRFSQKVST